MNTLYHRRLLTRDFNTDGTDFITEEWDNLIVLDACRYDLFAEENTLPGRLESRTSRGASTPEFLRGNFDGRELTDTVYVTANPQLHKKRNLVDVTFHDVIEVWKREGWHEELGTVLPETVSEYAREAAERYPRKRLIVHFMQPHYPFIDSGTEFDKGHLEDVESGGDNFWTRLMTGEAHIDTETIWKAYRDNLTVALPHIRDLMVDFTGRTVVTADHGNVVGERVFPVPVREWGHPRGLYVDALVKVPWLVFDRGERKHIVSEETVSETADVDEDVVEDRLKSLGYK